MIVAKYLEDYLLSSFDRTPSENSVPKEVKFYVSDSGKCQRVRWLKRKGLKSTFEPYVNWVLQIGNLYHDYAYKALESQGVLLSSEGTLENDHFKGRYDGIIKSPSGSKHLVDIKSAGSYKIDKTLKREDDEGYVAQIMTYLMMLQDEGRDDIESAIICYINKEPSAKTPVSFIDREYHLTSWREQKLREEMDQLVNFWVNDEVPPCSCPGWMKPYNAFLPFCSCESTDRVKEVLAMMKDHDIYSTNAKVFYRNDELGGIMDGAEVEIKL